jgi:hypothetical protein
MLNCPQGEPEGLKALNYCFEHGKRDKELIERSYQEDNREN